MKTAGGKSAHLVVLAVIASSMVSLACEEEEGLQVIGTPSGSPSAAEEKIERIVQAVPGAVAQARGVRMTFLEVLDPWTEYGSFEAPQPGTRYVAVKVSLENLGDRDHSLDSSNFQLKTSSYDGETTFFKAQPDLFAAGSFLDLSSGAKAEGWVTFVVAEGAQLTMLKYDPDPFTTDDIEFHFQ